MNEIAPTTVRKDSLDFRRFNVPRIDSSWWVGAAAPLRDFFKKGRTVACGAEQPRCPRSLAGEMGNPTGVPRTIDEVVEWGRQQCISGCMIRHMLAWLSFNDVVRYDEKDKMWKSVVRSSIERKRSRS